MTLRARIEQRIARLRVERDIAAAATPGPWGVGAEGSEGSRVNPRTGDIRNDSRYVVSCNGRTQPEDGRNAAHIATQDPATVIARIDRELAGCAADLALLDDLDDPDIPYSAIARVLSARARAALEARYPDGAA